MQKEKGKHTTILAKRLMQKLESQSRYAVYYDPHEHGTGEKNECHPTPFFGDYSGTSTLSHVDIVIVDSKNKKVRILCEIEESGTSPKGVIGDIVNIMLSEKLRIRDSNKPYNYEYDKPLLILGIHPNTKKNEKNKKKKVENIKKKVEEGLVPRLRNIIEEPYWNLLGGITILCEEDINKLIGEAESKILHYLK